jgi:hypothetical protein
VAELHGVGPATVLATDADLEIGPGRATLFDGCLHQYAHRVAIEDLEGVHRQDLLVEVIRQEGAAASAVDTGIALEVGLGEWDIDGQARDTSPDVGADEFGLPEIFAGDFESGNPSAWSHVVP